MNNKLIGVAIGAAVAIIVLGSVLMPVLEDESEIKVNHELDRTQFTYYATNVIGGETYTVDANKNLCYNGQALGTTAVQILTDNYKIIFYDGSLIYSTAGANNGTSVSSVTINSDGTTTLVKKADSTTLEISDKISWFVGPATTGNYVYSINGGNTLFNKDSYVYITYYGNLSNGTDSLINQAYIANAYGTATNLSCTPKGYYSGAWHELEGGVSLTTTDAGDGTYYLAKSLTTVGDYSGEGVASIFYAPLEYYTLEDSPYISLYSAIPVMIIISILLGAVMIMRVGKL